MKIKGIVKRHLGRGKKLGFPTANLDWHAEIPDGVYVGKVNGNMLALIFSGMAKTYEEKDKQLEVYILDFDQDIYDQEIDVELLQKIRDNKKFNSEAELIEQMKHDEIIARRYFGQ